MRAVDLAPLVGELDDRLTLPVPLGDAAAHRGQVWRRKPPGSGTIELAQHPHMLQPSVAALSGSTMR